MRTRELTVPGVVEFTPEVHADERGTFQSPFQGPEFDGATGHGLFPVAQVSYSRSRRAVVRGVHLTATPPGMAKYVFCPRGLVLDVVVDLRIGSPAFGRWDSVLMGEDEVRALSIPVGVGHLFVSLADDSTMTYILSGGYVRRDELAVSAFDPQLGLPIPADLDPVVSERDRAAPGLAEAVAAGLLPHVDTCAELDAALAAAGPGGADVGVHG